MRKRHSAPDELLAFMRVCKVPLSPKIERGTPLPRAFQQLPFLCCWRRKVPVCAPKSLKPRGRGGAFQNHRTVSTQRQTYTRTHTDTKVNDRSSSSDKPPTLGLYVRLESHGPAGLPRSGRCAARQQPVSPSRPAPTVSARPRGRERPWPHFGDARCSSSSRSGPGNSEGHDGCAPGAHVSQHRLVAADLPGLGGFRAAFLRLLFLPAARRAFP